jgi:hypothetical protein
MAARSSPGSPRRSAARPTRIRRRMGLVLTTIAALCLWIILWAMDFKAFDGFLIVLGMVVLAVTARLILPSLPGSRPGPDEPA